MKDQLNQYRVFPRAFAIFYLYWMGQVINWGINQPDLSNAQAAFIASIVTGAAAYFKFYVESGNAVQKD